MSVRTEIIRKIFFNVITMLDQRFEQPRPGKLCHGGRIGAEIQCPEPLNRTEGDIQTGSPADAHPGGICVDPRRELKGDPSGIPVIVGQPISLTESNEMRAAIDLPNDFEVTFADWRNRINFAPVHKRSALPTYRIEMPVYRIAELQVGITEQVEFPGNHLLRGGDDCHTLVREAITGDLEKTVAIG